MLFRVANIKPIFLLLQLLIKTPLNMNEEMQMILDDARDQMEKAISHLENELAKIRAGRANPAMLENIQVDSSKFNVAPFNVNG